MTSSRYSVNALNLPVETAWRPWYTNGEVRHIQETNSCSLIVDAYLSSLIFLIWQVGGYVVGYKGVTLTTIRGAGHTVPSYEPERALTFISAFLQGQLPPVS